MKWTIKTASDFVGGLSTPSKMPSFGTSTPAEFCRVGSELAKVEGTTCSKCYARKGLYQFPNVKAALSHRYDIVKACEHDSEHADKWVGAFEFLLNTRLERALARGFNGSNDPGFFRWHDSGDLIGLFHLRLIVRVAEATPNVCHWLPTRELSTVRAYLREAGSFPPNLRVRLSAAKIDKLPPTVEGCSGSAVHSTPEPLAGAIGCPAYTQQGECRDCRACWLSDDVISYPQH